MQAGSGGPWVTGWAKFDAWLYDTNDDGGAAVAEAAGQDRRASDLQHLNTPHEKPFSTSCCFSRALTSASPSRNTSVRAEKPAACVTEPWRSLSACRQGTAIHVLVKERTADSILAPPVLASPRSIVAEEKSRSHPSS